MNEAYVRLLCPNCKKKWEENPGTLPPNSDHLSCINCESQYRVAEFMRTERDLEILKRFHDQML